MIAHGNLFHLKIELHLELYITLVDLVVVVLPWSPMGYARFHLPIAYPKSSSYAAVCNRFVVVSKVMLSSNRAFSIRPSQFQ